MRHSFTASYQNIMLCPLEQRDIEKIRVWRNDSAATRFLRPIGKITPEMQQKWFDAYLKDENQIIFAIHETEKLNRMVGSVALYNFKQNSCEVGRIQIGDPEAHGMGIGRISLVMSMLIGFRNLGLKKITASVHQENISAYRNDMQIGFRVVGNHPAIVGGLEDEIEIDEERLLEVNTYAKDVMLCGRERNG